ncbi:unnamed protein product [Discosporangium mesarthrocarpum]
MALRDGEAYRGNSSNVGGGAIRVTGGTLTVIGCLFEDNVAGVAGGGGVILANLSTVDIEGTIFRHCEAENGGGVW